MRYSSVLALMIYLANRMPETSRELERQASAPSLCRRQNIPKLAENKLRTISAAAKTFVLYPVSTSVDLDLVWFLVYTGRPDPWSVRQRCMSSGAYESYILLFSRTSTHSGFIRKLMCARASMLQRLTTTSMVSPMLWSSIMVGYCDREMDRIRARKSANENKRVGRGNGQGK
jgi:hypothetical protein